MARLPFRAGSAVAALAHAGMPSARILSLVALFCSLHCVVGLATTRADGWPEGYELAEKSESPDGHYGVLLPSRLVADAIDDEDIKNTLVDLKSHHHLGVIRGAHYFPGQNHRGLTVAWAADSSWCAVTYEARYGFGQITLVEPHGGKIAQADLGTHIHKALNAAIARQAHDSTVEGYGSAYFRAGPSHTVLVRAYAFTNPKSLEDQSTWCALFEGTYDPASGKWTRSDSRKIDSGDPFEIAYGQFLDEGNTFSTEEDRLAWFDARLNDVYQAVRIVLPAERFAAVKKEQIAWLKQLNTHRSAADKCKFIGARIQQLRQLMW